MSTNSLRYRVALAMLLQAVSSSWGLAAPPEEAAAVSQDSRASSFAWKAGFAQADITPRPGLPVMAAGFAEPRIMEGVESPLLAQALALEDASGKRAILFAADLLGFGRITIDAVRHKVEKAHGIPAENVCFTASHTHWGPAVNDRTGPAIGAVNIWYLEFLETTLLDLADRALKQLTPAELAYGSCMVQIGMSRRLPGARGIQWAVNPEGSYDPHTPILLVRREGSPRQILVVGHACHPTSLGRVQQWSPDYPGAMRRTLAAAWDDCQAMFVNGCGGDAKVVYQDTATGKYEFAASLERSHQAGVLLAEAVRKRLSDGPPLEPLRAKLNAVLVRGALSLGVGPSREEIQKLAMEGSLRSYATWWARKHLAFPDTRRDFAYAVQAWQLGDLSIVALEGEVCSDWGALARSLPATKHAMTIGYANEVSAYIPTARIIREGGYEGDLAHKVYLLPAPLDPKMEVELTALIRRAVSQLSGAAALVEPVPIEGTRLLAPVDAAGGEPPIATPQAWESRRRQIVALVEQVTGPVPGPAFRVSLDAQVLAEVDCGTYIRKHIAYHVDPYDRVESYLLIPKGLRKKAPAILALHGTNPGGKDQVVGVAEASDSLVATMKKRQPYAHELAQRGYIVLAPDYWPYGHYRGQKYNPYQRGYASATMKGIWNHMRAIDLMETLPEVDAERIGAIGHSLGGYNTLFLGLFEPRVKAMVTSAGYNSFRAYGASAYGGGDLKNWGIDKHMRRVRTVYNNSPEQVPFDFPQLLAALAPRPVFTSAPMHDEYFAHAGVIPCLDAARPVYELFGRGENLVAEFPDTGHEFPEAQRQAAYAFLDRHLRQ
jgi:dienelactone hydrolase